MRKTLTAAAIAVIGLSSAACATEPGYGGRARYDAPASGSCYAGERRDDCRERLRVEQQNRRRYVWRNDHYEEQDTTGATVAAGIIGFLLGTAVAGSNNDREYYNSHRNDRGWRDRCRATYPNFDPATGTYVGQDGYRHYCTR